MPVNASATDWFRVYRPVTEPRLRLVCFPHAGAGPTTYRRWAKLLPSDLELLAVCYPGRQDRFGEPFAASIDLLAADIARAFAPVADTPFAFFGHSMGALVAYEVAVRLETVHGISPRHLFVSGRWAPDRTDHRSLHLAGDEALAAEVRRLGNPEAEILAGTELRELALAVLREDYRLLAAHRRDRLHRLRSPIAAYCGASDPGCSPQEMQAWSRATAGGFASKTYPGDHFYLIPCLPQLINEVLGRLAGRV